MRTATQQDFTIPEFKGKDPSDYEVREDGKCVRKDRWEMGVQRIREIVCIKSNADWEISDVIHAVEVISKLNLKTAEILEQIVARGFYDDFVEMMSKDCFDEAASVYAKAEKSIGADY